MPKGSPSLLLVNGVGAGLPGQDHFEAKHPGTVNPSHLKALLDELVARLLKVIERLERNDRHHDALLTYKEAAQLLGVSERKVKAYVASGELSVIDLDSSVRIHPKTLEAFIRERVRRGRK